MTILSVTRARSAEPGKTFRDYYRLVCFPVFPCYCFNVREANNATGNATMSTYDELEQNWACNDPMQEAMDHEFNAQFDRWDGYGDIDYAEREVYLDSRGCAADYRFDGEDDGTVGDGHVEDNASSVKTVYSDNDIPF